MNQDTYVHIHLEAAYILAQQAAGQVAHRSGELLAHKAQQEAERAVGRSREILAQEEMLAEALTKTIVHASLSKNQKAEARATLDKRIVQAKNTLRYAEYAASQLFLRKN